MAVVRFNPLNEVVGIQHEVNKLLENFFPGRRFGGNDEEFHSAVWRPVVDIHEDENSFIIDAELPGLSKENVKINFQDDTLTITGERRYQRDSQPQAAPAEGEDEQPAAGAQQNRSTNVHRMERSYGKFIRSFTFPKAVNADGIAASFENGILSVSVPKAEAAKPRQISIG